ncbi:MAG: phosphate signaling complex protein PhoU [Planctomycetes bacterium]|nr:phosphate signaling complex protein PhoU [Planctomycetota bacterium]
MHRHFEDELQQLKDRLVHMGALAEQMIDLAIRSLVERRGDRHPRVFEIEHEVNDLHIEMDERVISLIALRQPVAADLRFLIMSSKLAGELERIADQAVNICQNTAELLKQPLLKPLIDIPLMADAARRMLREGLDAFVRRDPALAQRILDEDDVVDSFKDQIFRELLTYMMSDPGTIARALSLILISRNLERVADHATNIAEEVIYLAQGRDVRHHHEEARLREPRTPP